jgi:hypothetical protein
MARRTRSWGEIKALLICLLIFGLIGIFVSIRDSINEKKWREEAVIRESQAAQQQELEEQAAAAYSDAMEILGTSGYRCSTEASLAVACLDQKYGKWYVPESYIAETPDEVRYLLWVKTGEELVGHYTNDDGAYIDWVAIAIEDLATGRILDSKEFRGTEPPFSKRREGDYHSRPGEEAILLWVQDVLENPPAATEEAAYVTVYARVPYDWYNVGCWAWSSVTGKDAFDQWPGVAMQKGQNGWYSVAVPSWANYVIINGNNGTVQTIDLAINAGVDVWITVNDYGESVISYN